MRFIFLQLIIAASSLTVLAAPAARAGSPLLVELFTSQSCSSCPPADALLARLAERPDLLALDLHVTYWDQLGWRDPFSLPEATDRQRAYSAQLGLDEVYTPQLVVGGMHQAVGSDTAAVATSLARAADEAGRRPAIALALRPNGAGIAAEIGAGSGAATLWLAGFDPHHVTRVGGGENGGRTLVEANVVRAIRPAGTWQGAPLRLVLARPAGERVAAFLQAPDGHILATAILPVS